MITTLKDGSVAVNTCYTLLSLGGRGLLATSAVLAGVVVVIEVVVADSVVISIAPGVERFLPRFPSPCASNVRHIGHAACSFWSDTSFKKQ